VQGDIGPMRPTDFSDRNATFAIGVGCKRGCSAEAIVALVERAIAEAAALAGAGPSSVLLVARKSDRGQEKAMTREP
jgi:cobalamin biosynthesis protein CbiG